MRTFALISILATSLFTAACVDTPDDTADVTASAREAHPIERALPSALHDEPSSDTIAPPSDDSLAAGTLDPAQPSTDTVTDAAGGRTLDPTRALGANGVAQPGTGVLPCRPIQERSALDGSAPPTTATAFDVGQRARGRWLRTHGR